MSICGTWLSVFDVANGVLYKQEMSCTEKCLNSQLCSEISLHLNPKFRFFHDNLFLPSPQLQTLTYLQCQILSHKGFSDTMKEVVAEVLVEILPLDDSVPV